MERRDSLAANEWIPASGFSDDLDFVIEEARFGTIDNYKDNSGDLQTLLIFEGTAPEDENLTRIVFSVGKGWEIVSGGAKVINIKDEDDNKRRFSPQSMYWKLIMRVMELGGVTEFDPKSKAPIIDNAQPWVKRILEASPRECAQWNGLIFHWNQETFDYKGLDREAKPHLMPTKFIGIQGGATTGASASGSPTDPLEIQAIAIAKGAADHASFMTAVFQLPGVTSNQALMGKVASADWFNQVRKG